MDEKLFRKAAIEKISSPDQLDLLMKVTSPVGWLALLALGLVLFATLVWSLVGSIPDLVESKGVLMRGERLREIQTPMAGTLERLDVQPGDEVTAGQVIAVIRAVQAGIEERQSAELALARTEQLLESKRHELASLQRQRAAQLELIEQGLVARNSLYDFDRNLNLVRGELNGLENEIRLLRSQLSSTAEVTAGEAGRVVEVIKGKGDRVNQGEPLLRLEPLLMTDEQRDFCDGRVHALLYVPGSQAAKVRSGQQARVSPSDIEREEYGYLLGQVEWVASYAASGDDVREKLKNDQLAQAFLAGGPVFEARVCLTPDPLNERNGLRWSSGKGPARSIGPGAPCSASMVVDRRRPYTYVIPAVRRAAGL